MLAEQTGDATPDGMQYLLAAARWDADAVRDDLRAYVIEHLGSADAVLGWLDAGPLMGTPGPAGGGHGAVVRLASGRW